MSPEVTNTLLIGSPNHFPILQGLHLPTEQFLLSILLDEVVMKIKEQVDG